MHEQRREQCVEKNGWVDLVVLDGGEVDDYDDGTGHLPAGLRRRRCELEVGLRLRPTDDRCMLADKFAAPDRARRTPKKGATVWEATRLFTTEAYRKRKGPGRASGCSSAGPRPSSWPCATA
jgi:acyl-homoserine lactone synthase